MKKRFTAAIAILLIIAFISSSLLAFEIYPQKNKEPPKVYVGVAFGGNTVEHGKMLIDKVKSYANLFILQSGTLQRDFKSLDELGNYAVTAGMYFLPYFGNFIPETLSMWLKQAKQRWGTHFLGVYYSDEPGGKMLDDYVEYQDAATGNIIEKTKYGDIFVTQPNGVMINYDFEGNIHLYEPRPDSDINSEETFYPNGTISVTKAAPNGFSYKSYQQLQNIRPFKDTKDTEQRFVERDQSNIAFLTNQTRVFTSDYGLYWFDYLSGYDVILGQLGWNISVTQQIAFLRGAATMQNKDWGAVITWKYQQSPYLDSGTEILKQLTTAYKCGAKYLVVFDYYTSEENPYGTLAKEHFEALESFWKNVARNPKVVQGEDKADSAVVLPTDYGYGARWVEDKVWGIFRADSQTEKVWNIIQTGLKEHGLQLDIVYDSKKFSLPQTYHNLYKCEGG